MKSTSPATQQALVSIRPDLKPGEVLLFHKRVFDFLKTSDHWFLTNQRLLLRSKRGLEEKTTLESGEQVIYHETGDVQFSGNVHLLTTQRLLVLDVGAKDYILESIQLDKITQVDISVIGKRGLNAINYALRIDVAESDEHVLITHGGITTGGIDQSSLSRTEQQQINERFPRKVCDVVGLKFAVPQKRIGPCGSRLVSFYCKNDLIWPESCSACNKKVDGLVFDKYLIENTWLTTYSIGFGLFPRIAFQIPYCPECYQARFESDKVRRAVQEGWANYDGARVDLQFENHSYAKDFIQTNSH